MSMCTYILIIQVVSVIVSMYICVCVANSNHNFSNHSKLVIKAHKRNLKLGVSSVNSFLPTFSIMS